jgi:hypothetical protein
MKGIASAREYTIIVIDKIKLCSYFGYSNAY